MRIAGEIPFERVDVTGVTIGDFPWGVKTWTSAEFGIKYVRGSVMRKYLSSNSDPKYKIEREKLRTALDNADEFGRPNVVFFRDFFKK